MNIKQEKDQASVTNTFALPHVGYFSNTDEECDAAVEWLHPARNLQAEGSLKNKTILDTQLVVQEQEVITSLAGLENKQYFSEWGKNSLPE